MTQSVQAAHSAGAPQAVSNNEARTGEAPQSWFGRMTKATNALNEHLKKIDLRDTYGWKTFTTVGSAIGWAGCKVMDSINEGYGYICKAGSAMKNVAKETPSYAGSAFTGAWCGLGGGYVLGGAIGVGIGIAMVAGGWPGLILALPTAATGGLIGGGIGGAAGVTLGTSINTLLQYRRSWADLCNQQEQRNKKLQEEINQLRKDAANPLGVAEEGRTDLVGNDTSGESAA